MSSMKNLIPDLENEWRYKPLKEQKPKRRRVWIGKRQQVYVKAGVFQSLHKHAGYLLKNHKREIDLNKDERLVAAISPEGKTLRETLISWNKDKFHHRLIISPKAGHKLDMKEFVVNVMDSVQRKMGKEFEWVAAIHMKNNAAADGNQHAHVTVRGTGEIISHQTWTRHLREEAELWATHYLGPETEAFKKSTYKQRQEHEIQHDIERNQHDIKRRLHHGYGNSKLKH